MAVILTWLWQRRMVKKDIVDIYQFKYDTLESFLTRGKSWKKDYGLLLIMQMAPVNVGWRYALHTDNRMMSGFRRCSTTIQEMKSGCKAKSVFRCPQCYPPLCVAKNNLIFFIFPWSLKRKYLKIKPMQLVVQTVIINNCMSFFLPYYYNFR